MNGIATKLLVVAATLVAYVLLNSLLAYLVTFYSPPRRKRREKRCRELCKRPYERVFITSRDGLLLSGMYYRFEDGAPLEIVFHGYKGTADEGFCSGKHIFKGKRLNFLVIEQRSHGRSEGNTISFGVKERYDCIDWISYAVKRFGSRQKIILRGTSMGATTVLMASALGLPSNVVGIIADSPFTSPKEIIKKVCNKDIKIPAGLSYPFLWLGAYLFGGFDLNEASAVSAVKKCSLPVLIIHGTEDRFVPFEMGSRIFSACASKEKSFLAINGADHVRGFDTDPEKYRQAVAAFTAKSLG